MTRDRCLIRNFRRIVLTGRDHVIFAGQQDEVIVHATDEPARWSELLQRLCRPLPRHAVSGADRSPPDIDDALLTRLVESGHLIAGEDGEALLDERRRVFASSPGFDLIQRERVCERLVVGCTGSVVAGLMAPTLLSLSYSGFQRQLDVILTETACRFLSRDLLESYGLRTWSDSFERRDEVRVPHVSLAQAADMVLVLPATADALNRIAQTACSDLLSLCIAACEAPVVLCPAMNTAMWNNTGVQRNLATLRQDGRYILEPSIIFGAADFASDAEPMYGGHGTLWSGPLALMNALAAVLAVRRTTDSGRVTS